MHSLISVESLSSACVNSLYFAEISFVLCVPLCDCNKAASIPMLKASYIAKNDWSGSGTVFDIFSVRSVFISSNRFWCAVVHSKIFFCL